MQHRVGWQEVASSRRARGQAVSSSLPSAQSANLPAITDRDWADIKFGVEVGWVGWGGGGLGGVGWR